MIVETIATARRILLDDVSGRRTCQELSLPSGNATRLRAEALTSLLIPLLERRTRTLARGLVIIVGRSGRIVESYLSSTPTLASVSIVHAHASSWDRSRSVPDVTTSRLDWMPIVDPQISYIIVLDDVISTGRTLELLVERNAWQFPKAKWYGAVWLTRKRRLRGYCEVDAAVLVTNEHGKRVPINSLSTLIEDRNLAVRYAQKHVVANASMFISALGGMPAATHP